MERPEANWFVLQSNCYVTDTGGLAFALGYRVTGAIALLAQVHDDTDRRTTSCRYPAPGLEQEARAPYGTEHIAPLDGR